MIDNSVRYNCLKKKNIVITGGATGIGSVIARHFYSQGSQVIILDVKEYEAKLLIKSMPALENLLQPKFIFCNLTNTESISNVFNEIFNIFGELDVLCNNAADDNRHDWQKISSLDWDYFQNINSKSQFFCIREFAKFTNQVKGASIICIGSIAYLNGTTEMPAYTTAKASLVGLVNTMAKILGKKRIRINLIQPGWIMTEKQLKKWIDEKAESLITKNQLLEGKIYPDEPAKLVLFLASEQSLKITKQIINIDAGWI